MCSALASSATYAVQEDPGKVEFFHHLGRTQIKLSDLLVLKVIQFLKDFLMFLFAPKMTENFSVFCPSLGSICTKGQLIS